MEEFYTIDHSDPDGRPIRFEGEFIEKRGKKRKRCYKVGDETIFGYKTARQARASWTDARAQDIVRCAKKKVAGMTKREILRFKPPGCTSYIDWCKWIVMYDGIPPGPIDCSAVDTFWAAFKKDHAALVDVVREREHSINTERVDAEHNRTVKLKYKRIIRKLFAIDESELDNVENALNVFTQST